MHAAGFLDVQLAGAKMRMLPLLGSELQAKKAGDAKQGLKFWSDDLAFIRAEMQLISCQDPCSCRRFISQVLDLVTAY